MASSALPSGLPHLPIAWDSARGEGRPQLGLVHRAQHPWTARSGGRLSPEVGSGAACGLEELADLGDIGVDVPCSGGSPA